MNKNLNLLKLFLANLFFIVIIGNASLYSQSVIYNRFDVLNELSSTRLDSNRIAFSGVVKYKRINTRDYFSLLPIYSHTSSNSEFANGFNDGYLWQGRGLNQSISAGIQGRKGAFEYTFAPVLTYNQNKAHELRTEFGNNPTYQDRFTTGIDYVRRYGNNSFAEFYLGQSEIAYSISNIRTSIGTQNILWGPAIYNQALMSNNANGFPHLRIESKEPWKTKAGRLEIQWLFGITKESDFFNNDSSDDLGIFNGFVLGYQPNFVPGLSLSIQRSRRILDKDRDSFTDYFGLVKNFFSTSQKNSNGTITESADQIISLGFDWRSQKEDFRVYLEWVKGDFASDIMDFLAQPEHNSGYVWGVVKNVSLKDGGHIRLILENANLAVWETGRLRSSGSLYTHSRVRQGYTNNGQILGAAIGPGSSSHSGNIAYVKGKKVISFDYLRTRYNDDVFYLTLFNQVGNHQDIQHYLGLHWKDQIDKWEYQIGGALGIRDDYLFIRDDLRFNFHPQMIIRYHFNNN